MAKKNKQKKGATSQGAEMVVYRGPIKAGNNMPMVQRVLLKNRFTIASGAAGFLEAYAGTNGAFLAPEFGSFAGNFREYRVLGIRTEYMPFYDSGGYIGSSNVLSVGAGASYHGAAPAFQGAVTATTDLSVWQMEGAKAFHPGKPLVLEWRMNDVEEAQFFSTSSAYTVGGVYSMVPTVTASRSYGLLLVSFLVEFKGRV